MSRSFQDILTEMENEREQAALSAESSRAEISSYCAKHMIIKIAIEFAGSGDSGQIHDIAINYEPGQPELSPSEAYNFTETLNNWAYKFLEGIGVDWYNNDGGQGTIIFDFTTVPYKFEANVDVNVTTSEQAYHTKEVL